jgi:proteasome accessory factor B
LGAALEKHQLVRFAYLKPGEGESHVRTVAPLALVQHQGRWHLYANDPDSGTTKTFLLRRIVSQVTTLPKTFPAPPADVSERALAELEEVWNSHTAIVAVEPGTDAATRLGKRRGSSVNADGALQLHYSDLNIFADELAGYGPEALVISPPELRAAVHARLERTAADHG